VLPCRTHTHSDIIPRTHTTQNVATAEVADALGGVPGFSDVTVYGVSVPDCDGKVGMAAVVLSEGTSAE
jgi:acyl-CoA synthetase (AMP-forming)/AMP-acid ligase II